MIWYEQVTFWRRSLSVVFTIGLPLLLLALFLHSSIDEHLAPAHGLEGAHAHVPALLVFALQGVCFNDLAIQMAMRRKNGVLKRLKLSPIRAWTVLAGAVCSATCVTGVLVVGALLLGWTAGAPAPAMPLSMGVVVLAGIGCFSALGVALGAVLPGADAAGAVGPAIFVPLNLLAGTFFALELPRPIRVAVDLTPVGSLLGGTVETFQGSSSSSEVVGRVAVLLAWGVVGVVLSLRLFRWEPLGT